MALLSVTIFLMRPRYLENSGLRSSPRVVKSLVASSYPATRAFHAWGKITIPELQNTIKYLQASNLTSGFQVEQILFVLDTGGRLVLLHRNQVLLHRKSSHIGPGICRPTSGAPIPSRYSYLVLYLLLRGQFQPLAVVIPHLARLSGHNLYNAL